MYYKEARELPKFLISVRWLAFELLEEKKPHENERNLGNEKKRRKMSSS